MSTPPQATSARIANRLVTLVPGLDTGTAQSMVEQAASRGSLAALEKYLAARPDALRSGDAEAPLVVLHLIGKLVAGGYAGVVAVACTSCGRPHTRLIRRGSTGRVCDMCWIKAHQRECAQCHRVGRPFLRTDSGVICSRCHKRQFRSLCGVCGQVWKIAARSPDGQPLCFRCYRRPNHICIQCSHDKPAHLITEAGPVCDHCYRQPQRPCGVCGRVRAVSRRATGDQPDACDSCANSAVTECATCGRTRHCRRLKGEMACSSCRPPRTRRQCARCARERYVITNFPIGGVCSTCYKHLLHHPKTCAACAHIRPLIGVNEHGDGLCPVCAGADNAFDCRSCAAIGQAVSRGLCPRCHLRLRLDDLLAGFDGHIATQLQPLADALLRSDQPRQMVNWLGRAAAARLLVSIGRTGEPITHHQLDQLPPSQAIRSARRVLVASGVLPDRCEYIEAVEPWLERFVSRQPVAHHQILTTYARWAVLHRARRRATFTTPTYSTSTHLQTKIRIVADFLNWLDARHLTLDQLRQTHVDRWVLDRPSLDAYKVRFFLRWATKRDLLTAAVALDTGPRGRNTTPRLISEDQRWTHLQRCLRDRNLPLDLRIVGALLLLFGHPVGRTVRLTNDDVLTIGGSRYLRLGQTPLLMPPALANLIDEQLQQPARTPLGKVMNTTTWLFPSTHPGGHVEPKTFYNRLAAIGITVRPGRRAALMALAQDLPAAVLARLIGLHITTAASWSQELKHDWSAYLSARITAPLINRP